MTTYETVASVGDFEDFYRAQRAPLVRLAHLLTGSPAHAEELAQEALLAVHQHWSTLDNPAGYARRSLVNLARSHHRRSALQRRHERDARSTVELPRDIDEMWQLVRRLAPDQRAVIVLRFYADMKVDEIADVLGKPPGTVKSLLHRTLATLKEALR